MKRPGETNPGEAMDLIVNTIMTKATILAVGAEDGAGAEEASP